MHSTVAASAWKRILLITLLGNLRVDMLHPQAAPPTALSEVAPIAYRIKIDPDVPNSRFHGEEEIDIEVRQPKSTVTLNAVDLSVEAFAVDGSNIPSESIRWNKSAETVTFDLQQPLSAGNHTLHLIYAGMIRKGLFTVGYDNGDGPKKLLLTQFEFSSARYMFPCWDAPAAKATFSLSATVPSNETALSNTPILHREHMGKMDLVTFGQTPRMSPYLLVLVEGDMQPWSDESGNVTVKAWTTTGRPVLGEAAVSRAKRLLPFYKEFLGIAYALPKLDMIAVPHLDFDAMENWGGITFQDQLLLYDPEKSSLENLRAMHHLVGHEIAHQWFGNLVTTATWGDVWLNESLAEWMSYKATEKLDPEEKPWLNFLAQKDKAMDRDSGPSQSIVGNSFNANTSYRKGPAILRMVETYLGEDVFQTGLRSYLKSYAYRNAATSDLWSSLESSAGRPVASIASTFTNQPGIPLVTVDTRCQNGQTIATLTQSRFTVDYPNAEPLTWIIPVRVGIVGNPAATRTVLLGKQPASLHFTGCRQPLKANLGSAGYYRSAYNYENNRKLIQNFSHLETADRVNLLSDHWALVLAAKEPASSYLSLAAHLSQETEPAPLMQALDVLRYIDTLERGTTGQGAFRRDARAVLQAPMQRCGWEKRPGESPEITILRARLISTLGQFDDTEVIAEARRRFRLLHDEGVPLPVELRAVILETIGRHADEATYDLLHSLAKTASAVNDKRDLYWALASVQDPVLIDRTVQITMTNEWTERTALLIGLTQRSDADRVWDDIQRNRTQVLDGKISSGLMDAIAQHCLDPRIAVQLPQDPAYANRSPSAVRDIEVTAMRRPRILHEVADYLTTTTALKR